MVFKSARRFSLVLFFVSVAFTGEVFGETRDEFRQKVVREMNQDQVVAAVGKPDWAEDKFGGSGTDYHYKNRTVDPGTGKKDRAAIVSFIDGRVIGIRFQR